MEKLFTREETLFKIMKPTKGIISIAEPNESDLLDCELLETMTLDELTYLKSLLPFGGVAYLWVDFEIKVRTYCDMAAANIKYSLAIFKRTYGSTLTIVNIDIDKVEGREKKNH